MGQLEIALTTEVEYSWEEKNKWSLFQVNSMTKMIAKNQTS